jgi:hypothetical protein
MFSLRLGDRQTTLTLVPAGDVKKLAMEVTKVTPAIGHTREKQERVAFIIEARELGILGRALEVIQRTLVGRRAVQYMDLNVLAADDSQLRGYIPKDSAYFDGPVALLYVSNPSGTEAAVYLDESSLTALADWAANAALKLGEESS